MSVDTPSAHWSACQPSWAEAQDILDGTKAMRAGATRYLPKHEKESDTKYQARLNRSFLYNVLKTTVDTASAKPFERPIAVEDLGSLEYILEDVDREGQNLTAFAKDLLCAALPKGVTYILVDKPVIPPELKGNVSILDTTELSLRPYFVHVKPENLIEVRSERLHGREVLTRIRIRETETVVDSDYTERVVKRVRMIFPDRFELWEEQTVEKKNVWNLIDKGVREINKIALVPVYGRRTGFMKGESPLQPLIEKNIEHWQSSSDQRNILHYARMPLLFGKALNSPQDAQGNPTNEIGASTLVETDSEHGDLRWVEISGSGSLVQGQNDVDKLANEMEGLGAQILNQRGNQPQTATGERRDADKNSSVLHGLITNLQNSITQALIYAGEWEGVKLTPKVDIFKDFSLFDPAMMTAADLLAAVVAGQISHEVYTRVLISRGAIPDDVTSEDMLDAIGDDVDDIPVTGTTIEDDDSEAA